MPLRSFAGARAEGGGQGSVGRQRHRPLDLRAAPEAPRLPQRGLAHHAPRGRGDAQGGGGHGGGRLRGA